MTNLHTLKNAIDRLAAGELPAAPELTALIEAHREPELSAYLFARARDIRHRIYGHDVYIRGLIELTNYCKNDCYYCGIRRSNRHADRYRLSKADILECCAVGHQLGFRTFVLQGGEDAHYTDSVLTDIIAAIRRDYPDCAITLSLGERSYESYRALKAAGADRYLLRHETANPTHYAALHPPELTLAARKQCLWDLKELGYQVGTGFMVGSPGQTAADLTADLLFIRELMPQMVGIGPFIPHRDTPFADRSGGTLELTLFMVGLLRLLLPNALLPATTALGTIDPNGREQGILAGANVLMPNLSPVDVRAKYLLYDNKICTGEEAAECRECLDKRIEKIGYRVVVDRGDCKAEPTDTD